MKADLPLSPPLMNAAGSLGLAPEPRGPVDLSHFGAFVTAPVSLRRRTPARTMRYAAYPGGFVLHTGYPNPGLSTVLQSVAGRWARSPQPVLVHLLCSTPEEVAEMVRRLEGVPGVAGFELGLPPEEDISIARANAIDFTQVAVGELPVIGRVPLEWALELGQLCIDAGASAVSFAPPRGALPGEGGPVTGRLYGPALFPLTFAAVRAMAAARLPVIAAGGVYSQANINALLEAGALAVQIDSWLWRFG